MARLFVAVWPPDDVLDRVAALERPDVAGLRWTTRHQWHVTLRFLGPVDDVGAVVDALAGSEAPAATVTVGPAVGRFGHRVLAGALMHGDRKQAAALFRRARRRIRGLGLIPLPRLRWQRSLRVQGGVRWYRRVLSAKAPRTDERNPKDDDHDGWHD